MAFIAIVIFFVCMGIGIAICPDGSGGVVIGFLLLGLITFICFKCSTSGDAEREAAKKAQEDRFKQARDEFDKKMMSGK